VFYKLYDRLGIKKTLATLAKEIRMGIRSSTSVTIEEIDEFKEVRTVTRQHVQKDWLSYMGITSEQSIKTMICEILGDLPRNDWGGELSDHFTTIHVGGKAYQAAFLFKGPSRFHEMKPSDLGKNADQIFRLTATPCDIMVIQHCHAIGEAVRATADAFASVPDRGRRYCLVDGIDTFRLLKAYCKI